MKSILHFAKIILFYFFSSILFAADPWQSYIDQSVGVCPYYLYNQVFYLKHYTDKNLRAIDLGSGAGDVDVDLAAKGWDVTGVDLSSRSGVVISARTQNLPGQFHFQNVDFSKVYFSGEYNLVTSFFALPFGQKNDLPFLLKNISSHLAPNGIFAANFFGPTHTYVINKKAYGLTEDELKDLLKQNNLTVIYFLHRNYDYGNSVHWDILDVIAVKK